MKKVLITLLAAATLASTVTLAETPFEKSAREKQEIAKSIIWPDHEPLMFLLRRGGTSEDVVERYERQHDPANIQRMFDAGVRYERLHFYKGFGLAAEGPEIARSKAMAERMHALGMKVSVYVAGTMFTETFYREVPEAVKWEQRDQNNLAVPYTGTQTYRHFACRNEPAYREYLKRALRVAVEEIKADEVFFDNIFEQPEPKSCHCARCLAAFRAYLHQRYPTKEACQRRFGYEDTDGIRIPEWYEYNRPDQVVNIDDPVLQEWVGFRCESLARHCGDLYDFVKQLNPKVSVGFNLKGIYGANRIWQNAVYHPLFEGRIDFSPFDSGGFNARYVPESGALVSEIRAFKMARTLDYSYQGGEGSPLEFSVYMAFNPQKRVGSFGYEGGPGGWGALRDFSPEAEFFRIYNDRYFTETKNVADVAVVHTWPSMAYSMAATRVSTILLEQVLIQHHVPFDIIFDGQMDQIGRYKAVIFPGQENLSQAWIDRALAFARQGGTVVFTGNTGDYTDTRVKRLTNPLAAALNAPTTGITVGSVGEGKFVYLPALVARRAARTASSSNLTDEANISTGGGRTGALGPNDWIMPALHEEIAHALATNVHDGWSLDTAAPVTVATEVLNRRSSAETIVHFVNFDSAHPAAAFATKLKKQQKGAVKSVRLFTPDEAEPRAIDFKENGNGVAFTVPAVRLYSMVVVEYQR